LRCKFEIKVLQVRSLFLYSTSTKNHKYNAILLALIACADNTCSRV